MKCIEANLSSKFKEIIIYIIADWHIGDKHTNTKQIQEQVKEIQEKENAFCILDGDLIDNATKTSVGDTYEAKASPMQCQKEAVNYLKPIKDKIIGITTGNHENRSYKTEGIDITYNICSTLGIEDKYKPNGIPIIVRFGKMGNKKESNGSGNVRKQCYTIYATHGYGGGSTLGGKANKLEKLKNVVNSDVYIMAHTHQAIVTKEIRREFDVRNNIITSKEMLFVNTASTLQYDGSYAERMCLTPSNNTYPRVILSGTSHKMEAIV